jgi:hypothetical protein
MRVPLLFLFLSLTGAADARIGETPVQFADRYGRPGRVRKIGTGGEVGGWSDPAQIRVG